MGSFGSSVVGQRYRHRAGPQLGGAGDGDAFRQLIEPYERELRAHCYRLLGSVQDAEDAMQDARAAWQGLDGFEGRASVRTWLFRIVTTRCLNARRSAGGALPPPGRRSPPGWVR